MAILSATGKSTAKDAFNNEANLNNFTAEMDVAITGINKTVRYEMARAVIAGFEGMVFNTPVRTGYAAGEWQVVGESQNIKPRKKDKNRAVRGWDSEHERLDRSRGKKKFSYGRFIGKSVDTMSCGENKNCGRSIKNVTTGYLLTPVWSASARDGGRPGEDFSLKIEKIVPMETLTSMLL